jgi:hypothetical protein
LWSIQSSLTVSFWPIPEVSLDEKRRTGKRSKAATQKFRAILSATDPKPSFANYN